MATLDPSNITTGNIIQASDIAQLYSAFGTGSSNITGLSMTGSITNATAAVTATSASNVTTAITGGGTHYLTFVDQAGTRPPKIASLLEYTATTNNLQVTASYATSASFALNSNATQVNSQNYDGGGGVTTGNFKFIAGKAAMTGGTATSSIFTALAGKTLGTNAWITANFGLTDPGSPDNLIVTDISSSGAILFDCGGIANGTVIFTGIYI